MDFSTDKAPSSLPAVIVGDHFALDFLNSIAAPHGQWIEWIGDGHALLRWLEGAGKIQPSERREVVKTFSQVQLDDVAAGARELREWFRELLARVKERGSKAVSQRDIDRLNRNLASASLSRHLQRDEEDRLGLVWRNHSTEPRFLLALVAEAIAELLCEEDLSLVSRCEGPSCSIWFYDRTKSHHRRFCTQAICGNRARVTAFRQRKRGGS